MNRHDEEPVRSDGAAGRPAGRPSGSKTERLILIIALVCLMGWLVWYTRAEQLAEHYVYHDDVAKDIYWRVRLHNPEAFPNDLLADFSEHIMPPGIKAIYYPLTRIWDPVAVGEWLFLIYLSLTLVFLFKLGESLDGPWCGFTAAGLTVVAAWNVIGSDTPGDGGDFFMPLLAGFVWALVSRRYLLAGAFLVTSSLFHPQIALIALATLVLAVLRPERRLGLDRLTRREILWLGASVLLCVGWNFYQYLLRNVHRFGETMNREAFYSMPEFREGGCYTMIFDTFGKWLRDDSVGLIMNPAMAALLVGAVLLLLLNRRAALRIGRAPWALLVAGVLLFTAATLFLPLLFKPTRFFYLPAMIFLGCFVAYNLRLLVKKRRHVAVRALAMGAPVLLLAWFSAGSLEVYSFRAPDEPLYEYLSTLPPNAMIAAHPGVANHIPTFSRRSVLVNSEMSEPQYLGYYEETVRRIRDVISALYARDPEVIRDFCERRRITHIVVSDFHYSPEYLRRGRRYYDPIDNFILETAANPEAAFLANLPEEKKLFSYSFVITRPLDRWHNFHWQGIRRMGDPESTGTERGPVYSMYVTSCDAIAVE